MLVFVETRYFMPFYWLGGGEGSVSITDDCGVVTSEVVKSSVSNDVTSEDPASLSVEGVFLLAHAISEKIITSAKIETITFFIQFLHIKLFEPSFNFSIAHVFGYCNGGV